MRQVVMAAAAATFRFMSVFIVGFLPVTECCGIAG
jgi:hypothetical protein